MDAYFGCPWTAVSVEAGCLFRSLLDTHSGDRNHRHSVIAITAFLDPLIIFRFAFLCDLLTKRVAFQVNLVRLVHDPIQDGIGQRRIWNEPVPLFDWELAGEDQGAAP
jgi:hypothetical protein